MKENERDRKSTIERVNLHIKCIRSQSLLSKLILSTIKPRKIQPPQHPEVFNLRILAGLATLLPIHHLNV